MSRRLNKPLIDECQYCSTSRATRRPVRWRAGLWQAFPSFPSPSPSLILWLLFHFSLGQNRKFHGLSLLQSQMQMLATQASGFKDIRIRADGTQFSVIYMPKEWSGAELKIFSRSSLKIFILKVHFYLYFRNVIWISPVHRFVDCKFIVYLNYKLITRATLFALAKSIYYSFP